MKILSVLFVLLFATLVAAEDVLYLSALSNGNPPQLFIRKFARATPNGPYQPLETAVIPLTAAGGLTDLQLNGTSGLHVYFTQQQGSKVRVVREAASIASGVSFVSGGTKNFPANLTNLVNFDTNDVTALVQKLGGSQLHTQAINAAGNLFGGFKPQPKFPAAPFGSRISEGKPYFITALWTDPASGRTGITFQNVTAPTNARSFLFSGRVISHDSSLTLPKEVQASGVDEEDECDADGVDDPLDGCVEDSFEEEDEDDLVPGTSRPVVASRAFRVTPFVRSIRRSDFTPVGNVYKLNSPRVDPSAGAHQFNGIDIEPLGTAIFYLRHNTAGGFNEVLIQTYNPITHKKVGGPKVALAFRKDAIYYGLSSLNTKFKNGVTAD